MNSEKNFTKFPRPQIFNNSKITNFKRIFMFNLLHQLVDTGDTKTNARP